MWNQSIFQRLCTNRLSLSLWRSHTFCFANATVLNASKHEAWNLKISSSWRFIVPPPAGKRTWQLPDKDDLKEMTSNLARSVRVKVMQPPIRHMRDCLNEIDSRHLSEVLNSSGKRSPSSKVEKKLGKIEMEAITCAVSWFPRHLSQIRHSLSPTSLSFSHYYTFVWPRKSVELWQHKGEAGKSRCSVPILHLND